MKSTEYLEQRCSACPARCRGSCQAPCRTNFDPMSCTLFGIWNGRPLTKKRGDSSLPPRRPLAFPGVKSHGRLNRPPSPNEKRCERVVGSGSCAISRWAMGGGAGGSKSVGNEPRESRSLGGGCFFVWGELGRRDRVQVAEFEG